MIRYGDGLYLWPIAIGQTAAAPYCMDSIPPLRASTGDSPVPNEQSPRLSERVLAGFMCIMMATVLCIIFGMITNASVFLFLTIWGSMANIGLLILGVIINLSEWDDRHGIRTR